MTAPTPAQIETALLSFSPGSTVGQGSPAAWRCRICEQFGFAGPKSISHRDDCILPALTAAAQVAPNIEGSWQIVAQAALKEQFRLEAELTTAIERCAQVAEKYENRMTPTPHWLKGISAEIRKLKDQP